MTEIPLREWGVDEVFLPQPVVADLVANHRDHLEVTPTESPDRWRIRAQQFVGTVTVRDTTILVRPKVHLPNLLALMGVELPASVWHAEQASLAAEPNLLVAMAKLFCISCEETTRRGIRRDYVTTHERLIAPRGRIDLRALIRRPGVEIPAPCVYDDHTANIPLNRVVKDGLSTCLRLAGLPPVWRRRVLAQMTELEEVESGMVDTRWVADWTPSPMERHYESTVRLAALLLAGSSVSDRFGNSLVSSFLLDMNDLFERFVTAELRKVDGVELEDQADITLGSDGSVQMRPDLAFHRGGRVVAVADCKYKVLDSSGGRTSDYYQALAYATAYQLSDAWLLYAIQPGASAVPTVPVRGADITLHAIGLDLNQPIDELRAEIADVGELIVNNRPAAATALAG